MNHLPGDKNLSGLLLPLSSTRFRQEMTARHGERRFAVEHERYGEYGAQVLYLANPRLPLWQSFRDGPHPRDPKAKHRAPLASRI
jgi:hypothetical protein